MSSGGTFGIVIFAGIIILLIGVAVYLVEQRRREAMRAWAATRGYTYVERDASWDDVDLGTPGTTGRVQNVFRGERNGWPFTCYERMWTTSNGKSTQTHYRVFWVLHLPRSLPRVVVGREGIFSLAARSLGLPDIEFESEDFNRAFKVHGDRETAYDIVNPQMMRWLMDTDAPGFRLDGQLLAISESGRVVIERIEASLNYLEAVTSHFPKYVWDSGQ